jgi:hypothetical protein
MKTHGGKRKGAGRPKLDNSKKKEPTVVMRIPKSKVELVKLIKENKLIAYPLFR